MYIAIEGIDRAGKSTQINMLKNRFKEWIYTKEPGGTRLGKKIRDILLHSGTVHPVAEYFLFLADRNEHINSVVKPNLDKTIVSDRSYISGIAYAHANHILPLKELIELNETATQGIYPDKVVLLKLSQRELEKRFHSQSLDSIEKRGPHYLMRVQNIMQELIEKRAKDYLILDASEPAEDIFEKITNFIKGER